MNDRYLIQISGLDAVLPFLYNNIDNNMIKILFPYKILVY